MNDADGTMTLTAGGKGHKVAGKVDRPIIDLCGKWVTQFMGNHSHFKVTTLYGEEIHIRAVNDAGGNSNPSVSATQDISAKLSDSDLAEISELIESLSEFDDVRKPGDTFRSRTFIQGWRDAVDSNNNDYSQQTLSCVTWQNLGYRFGLEFGERNESWIVAVYKQTTDIWDGEYFAPTSDEVLLETKSVEYEELLDSEEDTYEGEDVPPSRSKHPTYNYKTSARVKGKVRRIAKGICELCELPAPFTKSNGKPYLEVHHVKPLSDSGLDKTTNAVAICPNCHMRCHHSVDANEAAQELYSKVERLVSPS